jgi:hypothetical protein
MRYSKCDSFDLERRGYVCGGIAANYFVGTVIAKRADLLGADKDASEEARIEGVEVIECGQGGAIKEPDFGRP